MKFHYFSEYKERVHGVYIKKVKNSQFLGKNWKEISTENTNYYVIN